MNVTSNYKRIIFNRLSSQDLINRIDFHEKIDFFKNKILKITEKKKQS